MEITRNNLNEMSGVVYFVVGRGTEGGPASSYRLSVAGVTRAEWGMVSAVAYNSGYTLGTIQVDLGVRGEWPVGSSSERKPAIGETAYVDAIIR